MTTEPNVVYEPRRPRYLVRENGITESGHHTFLDAIKVADRFQRLFPYNTYDASTPNPNRTNHDHHLRRLKR